MKAPTLWVATAFCAGIGVAPYVAVTLDILVMGTLLIAFLGIVCYWKKCVRVQVLCLSFLFVQQGILWKAVGDFDIPPDHLKVLIASQQLNLDLPSRVVGTVSRDPIKTPFGYLIRIDAKTIENAKRDFRASGGVRLVLPMEASEDSGSPVAYGDQVEVLVSLRLPKTFRNPGCFDFAAQMGREGIYLVGNIKSERLLRKGNSSPRFMPVGLIYRLRHRLDAEIERAYQVKGQISPAGAALKAILLGNRYFLDRPLEQDFQATGIYHVLVIAGLHVGIIAWFLLSVFRLIRIPKVMATAMTLFILFGYACMVEARTPIVRAVIMASVYLFASLLDRDRSPLNAIGIAALVICLWQPSQLADPGFQLSFASVLSIAGIGAPLVRRWVSPRLEALEGVHDPHRDVHLKPAQAALRVHLRFLGESFGEHRLGKRIPGRVLEWILVWGMRVWLRTLSLLVFSLSIQITFALLMAVYFNRASLSAPFLNIVAIPMMGLVVPLGLVELATSFLSLRLASILAGGVSLVLDILIRLSHGLASSMFLNYRVVTPPVVVHVVGLASIVALAFALERRHRRSLLFAGSLTAMVTILVFTSAFPQRDLPAGLSATVLDVGQGDSLLICYPDRQMMLVDGGGVAASGFHESGQERRLDIGEDVVMPFLWGQRIRHLNQVVLTHAHNDHLSGLIPVLKYCSVDELWLGELPRTPLVLQLLEEAERRSVRVRWVKRGEEAWIGGTRVAVLSAGRGKGIPADANHDDSIVMRLDFGQTSMMLMGDASKAVESRLPVEKSASKTTVLKVGHHGSNTSTSEAFLERAKPQFAIISVASPSPFGHPSPLVLERLIRHGVSVHQTGREGAIQAVSDGRKWVVMSLMQ
jgi:competence protein ComEC